MARARHTAEEARAQAQRALETFLLHHDLPGSEVGLRLTAEEERYSAQAQVATPFGVEASFELQIPEAHEWGHHVRVGDLTAGTEIHAPLESGLFFKKVAVQSVKLDRLYVTAVHLGSVRGAMTLRRQPTSGAGYKIDFDSRGERTRVLMRSASARTEWKRRTPSRSSPAKTRCTSCVSGAASSIRPRSSRAVAT